MAANPHALFQTQKPDTVNSAFLPEQALEVGQALVKITYTDEGVFKKRVGTQLFMEVHLKPQQCVYSGSVIVDADESREREQKFLEDCIDVKTWGLKHYDHECYFLLKGQEVFESIRDFVREQSELTGFNTQRSIRSLWGEFVNKIQNHNGVLALTVPPPPARGCECVLL